MHDYLTNSYVIIIFAIILTCVMHIHTVIMHLRRSRARLAIYSNLKEVVDWLAITSLL
jgi:hypothetical protein